MLPRQPACSSHAVGSIITTSSASSGSRASSGVSADSATGSSSRPKNRQRTGAPASASSIITAQRALHVGRAEPVHAPAVDPARAVVLRGHGVEVAGEQDRRVAGPGEHARVAEVAHRRRRRRRRTPATCAASRASSRDSDGMSISSSVRAASRSPRSTRPHNSLPWRVRYCGVDISAKPANQQLVTLHERRAPEGGVELVATFYAPGTRRAGRAHDRGLRPRRRGRGRRRAVGPAARPARRRRAAARRARAARRALRADAGLRRAAVPARAAALPGAGAPASRRRAGRSGSASASSCSPRSPASGSTGPTADGLDRAGRGRRAALRAAVRDLPRRDLLRPARPPAVAQAHAVGPAAADRGAAHEGRPRRRRRALAPHARRAGRLRRRLRRLRARRRPRALGRRAGGGRDRAARRRAARPLRQAAAAGPRRRWPDDAPTLEVRGEDPLRPHRQSRYTPTAAAGRAPSSAPTSSARCPRATSPSSRSCCAPPASRSSAS